MTTDSSPPGINCDPNFDWRKYITIDIDNPGLRQATEVTLDRFANTPEGQDFLRKIPIVQQERDQNAVAALNLLTGFMDEEGRQHYINIIAGRNKTLLMVDHSTEEIAWDSHHSPAYEALNHELFLRVDIFGRYVYEQKDHQGQYSDFNFEQVLRHELQHVIQQTSTGEFLSGFMIGEARNKMLDSAQNEQRPLTSEETKYLQSLRGLQWDYLQSPRENDAVAAENQFMSTYYGAKHEARGDYRATKERPSAGSMLAMLTKIEPNDSEEHAPTPETNHTSIDALYTQIRKRTEAYFYNTPIDGCGFEVTDRATTIDMTALSHYYSGDVRTGQTVTPNAGSARQNQQNEDRSSERH